jgi:hypothetical protein
MMSISSTKSDRVGATLAGSRSRAGAVAVATHGHKADWSALRPLTTFARSVRVLVNEAIDATRGRYDR